MAQAASAQGLRARIVRRYRHGSGWQFVLMVEGFGDHATASAAAEALASTTGRGISVFSADPGIVPIASPQMAVVAAPAPSTNSTPVPPAPQAAPPSPDVVLRRSVRAVGGSKGGVVTTDAAQSLQYRFRRTTPDGQVIEHLFARKQHELRVEIRVIEGEGVSSTTTVLEHAAYVQVEGKGAVEVDRSRALVNATRFAPGAVLGLGLTLAASIEQRPEFDSMRNDGTTIIGSSACHVLRFDGDSLNRPLVLAVATHDWSLREATFGAGLRIEYSDWTDHDAGVVVPHRVRTWRHEALIDDVEVLELDLAPNLPAAWFTGPVENGPSVP